MKYVYLPNDPDSRKFAVNSMRLFNLLRRQNAHALLCPDASEYKIPQTSLPRAPAPEHPLNPLQRQGYRIPSHAANQGLSPAAKAKLSALKDRAAKLVEKGDAASLRSDYTSSIRLYTKAIGRHFLREAYSSLVNADTHHITELYATEPGIFARRAIAYCHDQQFTQAREDYRRAVAIRRIPNVEYLVGSVRCHLALGIYENALSDIKAALSIAPKNAAALRLKIKAKSMCRYMNHYHASIKEERYPAAISALLAACDLCEGGVPGNWCSWLLQDIRLGLESGMGLDLALQAAR